MGLFPSANDFKAGKGVEKDAPRKTGVRRFFELVGRDMNSMFLANLLTCLGFVPVISLVYIGFLMNNLPVMLISAAVGGILAGPVLAGMYDTVLRALRDEAGYWWVTYRKAFKRNFKASILPGVLYCVVVTLQIFLVEQNAKMALSIANRAYVLETGRISMSGKASDLLNDKAVQKAYLGE